MHLHKMTSLKGEKMNDGNQEGAFAVIFDKYGNPIDLQPITGCRLEAGDKGSTSEDLKGLLDFIKSEYKEDKVSAAGCHLIHVHSSPGCYILTASGKLKCVCCG
jgi:hypothetical protein